LPQIVVGIGGNTASFSCASFNSSGGRIGVVGAVAIGVFLAGKGSACWVVNPCSDRGTERTGSVLPGGHGGVSALHIVAVFNGIDPRSVLLFDLSIRVVFHEGDGEVGVGGGGQPHGIVVAVEFDKGVAA